MAVIKAKPEKFIPFTLGLVVRRLIVPQMITRVADSTFVGAKDDTVSMNVPGLFTVARKYEFRTRTNPIVLDDIQGGGKIDIKLDTHTYSATSITNEQATLDEIDWTREVMLPQAEAVANDIENDVVDAFNALRYRRELPFAHGDDPYLVAIEAQRIFDGIPGRLVPTDGRFWLCGSNVVASILAHDRVSRSAQGTAQLADNALLRAEVAQIGGFRVVKSLEVDPNFSCFMSKSALVLGTVAPVVPRGVAQGQRITQDGFGMLWTFDYDSNFQRDRSVVSMFSGLTPVYDERVGGTGTDRFQLKTNYTNVGADVPKSFRAIKVNFDPAGTGATEGTVLPTA
jgi:hypothetical protein